jgi:hypothetical protein
MIQVWILKILSIFYQILFENFTIFAYINICYQISFIIDKSVEKMMYNKFSVSSQQHQNASLANLASSVNNLEAQTLEERKTFDNAITKEARSLFNLKNIRHEIEFLNTVLHVGSLHENTERYKSLVSLVSALQKRETRNVKELSKWAEIKRESKIKFLELRKQFYKASGTFIETPPVNELVLKMNAMEPRVRKVFKYLVTGFLENPEGPIEISDEEEEEQQESVMEISSTDTLDLNVNLANISLPSSSEEVEINSDENIDDFSLPPITLSSEEEEIIDISDENINFSLLSIYSNTSETSELNEAQVLLDEEFVKEEFVFYDNWLKSCNLDLQKILERKKRLDRHQREATVTLSGIKNELSKEERAFHMTLKNFEESLEALIEMARNVLRHEEEYSASMGGIAKLWIKRLEPQMKRVK